MVIGVLFNPGGAPVADVERRRTLGSCIFESVALGTFADIPITTRNYVPRHSQSTDRRTGSRNRKCSRPTVNISLAWIACLLSNPSRHPDHREPSLPARTTSLTTSTTRNSVRVVLAALPQIRLCKEVVLSPRRRCHRQTRPIGISVHTPVIQRTACSQSPKVWDSPSSSVMIGKVHHYKAAISLRAMEGCLAIWSINAETTLDLLPSRVKEV